VYVDGDEQLHCGTDAGNDAAPAVPIRTRPTAARDSGCYTADDSRRGQLLPVAMSGEHVIRTTMRRRGVVFRLSFSS